MVVLLRAPNVRSADWHARTRARRVWHARRAIAAAVVAVVVVVADAVVVVVRVLERPGRHAVAGAASVVLVVVLQLVQECSYVELLFKFSQH